MLKQEANIPLDEIIAQFGPPTDGGSRKSMLQALFEEGLEETSSDGSEEELTPSESDTERSGEDSPSPSQDKDDTKSPSQPKSTNGILKKSDDSYEDVAQSSDIFALDASSNLEVPFIQPSSLPSPIKSPDKLSQSESDNPELEETEATLKRELEELDRTPLLPETASSDEELCTESEEKQPLYKLNRKNKSEGFDSGTTAVVCVIYKGDIIVANAGDSRCVLSRQGEAYPLSFDHKPTDIEELKRIDKAGGTVGLDGRVNSGLNLSRAIGDHIYKLNKELPLQEQMISALPDINSTTLQSGDSFILLACDGIFNVMDNQEAITFVQNRLDKINLSKEGPSALARICEELCQGCLADDTNNDGSGCDNMTAIIVVPDISSSDSKPNSNSNSSRKRKSSDSTDSSKRLKSGSIDSC
ncbi:Phosphatase 2C gamma [Oopsacas minuta]|uniref:protein-serine/threonine phosphatase n=1 Tax=Oopsacas minuta TaxID=111878 RepID=A0AAV7K6Y8_9METZ|nr:Phosphatase 2C gamma [Oopsacas minuta]